MEKRVVFRSTWLPWLLMVPQMAVILVFFFWPAAQAILQSLQQQDPFGTSIEFVAFANFRQLFADPGYLETVLRQGRDRVTPIAAGIVKTAKERMGLYTIAP